MDVDNEGDQKEKIVGRWLVVRWVGRAGGQRKIPNKLTELDTRRQMCACVRIHLNTSIHSFMTKS